MAILLAVSALAVPTIQRAFSRQALTKGAGMLRATLGKARVRSLKTGEIHAVYYIPGESWHGVAPFANVQEQMSIANQRAEDARNRSPFEDFAEDLLPRGVVFIEGQAAEDARAAQAVEDNGQSATGNVRMILFYPDGTSQDAQIIIENDKGAQMQVDLRGLTGTATSSHVLNGRR